METIPDRAEQDRTFVMDRIGCCHVGLFQPEPHTHPFDGADRPTKHHGEIGRRRRQKPPERKINTFPAARRTVVGGRVGSKRKRSGLPPAARLVGGEWWGVAVWVAPGRLEPSPADVLRIMMA